MKIITDEAFLRVPCKPISVNKGLALGRKLHLSLLNFNKHNKVQGVGLSAPQIGEFFQVCIIRVNKLQLTLVNPRIVDHCHTQVPFREGCLSFPGLELDTFRWGWVTVECDNIPGQITFGNKGQGGSLLEAVVVQHELDHLRGVLFKDRATDLTERYEGYKLEDGERRYFGGLT